VSPPTITTLEPAPRRPHRVVVELDGRTLATLPQRVVEELNLAVGQTLDDAQLGRLRQAATCDQAVNDAGAILARRALSRAELSTKLAARGFAPDVVTRALETLHGLGLINDEELGRSLLRETLAKQPAGAALLRAKLERRGLDPALVERLLAEPGAAPTADALPQALALVRARLGKMAHLDPEVQQRRLYALLGRRGFDEDTARRLMDEIFPEPSDGPRP
jgi:regulatory protein